MVMPIVFFILLKVLYSFALVDTHRHIFVPGETYLESVTIYNTTIVYVTCKNSLPPHMKACNLTVEFGNTDDSISNSTCVIPFDNEPKREIIRSSHISTSSDKVIVISGGKRKLKQSGYLQFFIYHLPGCIPKMKEFYIRLDDNMDIREVVEYSPILSGPESFEVAYADKNYCDRNCSQVFDYTGASIDGPSEFDFRIRRSKEMVRKVQPISYENCQFCIQLLSEERLNTSLVFNENTMKFLESRDNSIKISTAHGFLSVCKQESIPSNYLNCSGGNLSSWYTLEMDFDFEGAVIHNLPGNEGIMVIAIERKSYKKHFNHQMYFTVFDSQGRKFKSVELGTHKLFSRDYLTFIYIYIYENYLNDYCISTFEQADFGHDYEYDAMCFPRGTFSELIGRNK